MSQHPRVTVVVCTRNRPALLEQCLAALSKQTYRDFEVLVVDNASSKPARGICEAAGVRYVFEPIPGVARASNTGVHHARGDVVAFIDDDAIAAPDWLETLAGEFADHAIDAVTGSIQYMKSLGDSRRMSIHEAQSTRRARKTFDRTTPRWFCAASFGGIGDGSNMAFRRSVFAGAMRFEERLGRGRLLDGGFEHVAFMRVIEAGGRIVHAPDSMVLHPTPSIAPIANTLRARALQSSIAYLMFLWAELPRYRLQLCGFVCRAIGKRVLRFCGLLRSPNGLPVLRAITSLFQGIALYWRAREQWKAPVKAAEGFRSEGTRLMLSRRR